MKESSRIEVYIPHLGRTGWVFQLPTDGYDYYTIDLDFIPCKDNGLIDLPRESFEVLSDG